MNKLVLKLENVNDSSMKIGGKARSLAFLINKKIPIPNGSVIVGEAYDKYLEKTGLRGRILIELSRKKFQDMRWEELWDASQRIRNMFNTTKIPNKIMDILEKELNEYSETLIAVRSSANSEDSEKTSFAGLHDSYVNVIGVNKILEKTKLVWSSLWSDSALLYRKELNLSIEQSNMPVLIQRMIQGESSGVVFSKNPTNKNEILLEAVYGLCKGLVDGLIEPDRWTFSINNRKIKNHHAPVRKFALRPTKNGTIKKELTFEQKKKSPLTDQQAVHIAKIAMKIEKIFGKPQDIEWTIKDKKLYIIQSRPITTQNNTKDIRNWYNSLKIDLQILIKLEKKITEKIIPKMINEAEKLEKKSIEKMTDNELIEEINYRTGKYSFWHKIYWDNFIPMAHGMRIFGQVYNDRVKPEDPHEFVNLLEDSNLLSIQRNKRIEEIAKILNDNPSLEKELVNFENKRNNIKNLRDEIEKIFGGFEDLELIIGLLKQISKADSKKNKKRIKILESNYLKQFLSSERKKAKEFLRIGRRSWKLRDDDNIFLSRIQNQQKRAIDEAKKRLLKLGLSSVQEMLDDEVVLSLLKKKKISTSKIEKKAEKKFLKPRQLLGQPASPGIVTGKARVIENSKDLFNFKKDEILVIDAIDPTMTFIVPIAAGIIERRGGMLIHGAIIAREYGIPCVTGIPLATKIIKNGDFITVDGFLGIIIIN